MNRVACIVLSGGQGTRLFPLTAFRCKPAIYFAGRYRLIDVPISNALNSGILKIFVLTQFLSSSLHRHILDTYRLGFFSQGFIDLLGAEQKPEQKEWYAGTADAVHKNLSHLKDSPVDYFIILSGDQLYNMDFQEMISFAEETDSDLTIASLPVQEDDIKRMGALKINDKQEIVDFYEKPTRKSVLDKVKVTGKLSGQGKSMTRGKGKNYLGSMGIYVFKKNTLLSILEDDDRDDFGKHLIPTLINNKDIKVSTYLYDGYWEDIGTIKAFYDANMLLTTSTPGLNCYDDINSIYTRHYNLPGPKITDSRISSSIICEGSIVDAKEVSHSILGTRSVVGKNSVIKNSYVIGNDFYVDQVTNRGESPREVSIGKNCILDKVILDKNVSLGDNVSLTNPNNIENYDGDHVYIRDGITIVTDGASIPAGFTL